MMCCGGFRLGHSTPLVLKNEPSPVIVTSFYVAGIDDERPVKAAVARLATGFNTANESADLEGGALAAVQQFIKRNLSAETRIRPVIISIKQLSITETALPGNRVQGKIAVSLSFNLKRTEDTIHIISYDGGMQYNRPLSNRQMIEPCLRRSLMNALNYFNNWMNREAAQSLKLATAVKLNFTDYNSTAEPDTIYYSRNRPLQWDDFKAKVRGSRFAAEVFPSLGFDEHYTVSNSTIYINVAMKVYVPKSACWVRGDSRNDYTLRHEQGHFNIVKIVSERYKRRMLQMKLPAENYDGDLYTEYFEALRELNKLQDNYDDDTRHGTDAAEQERWNTKIEDELKKYGVL